MEIKVRAGEIAAWAGNWGVRGGRGGRTFLRGCDYLVYDIGVGIKKGSGRQRKEARESQEAREEGIKTNEK